VFAGEMADGLEALAAALSTLGKPDEAARLLAAASTWRAASKVAVPPQRQVAGEGTLERLQATLRAERFTAAWEAGQALSLEQAVAGTLELAPSAEDDREHDDEPLPISVVENIPSAVPAHQPGA
jgi:hypothetical protein